MNGAALFNLGAMTPTDRAIWYNFISSLYASGTPVTHRPIYIAYGDGTPTVAMPSGVTINNMGSYADNTVNSLVDIDNVTVDITSQIISGSFIGGGTGGGQTGDNSGAMSDYQLEGYMLCSVSISTATVRYYLPAGTYTLDLISSRSAIANNRVGEFTFNGSMQALAAASDPGGSNTSNIVTWTGVVSTGQYFDLGIAIEAGSDYSYLNGVNIERTS